LSVEKRRYSTNFLAKRSPRSDQFWFDPQTICPILLANRLFENWIAYRQPAVAAIYSRRLADRMLEGPHESGSTTNSTLFDATHITNQQHEP
jgi:hypothetical protein